jgi:deferrochelatase/peroxidase EfeB
MAKTTFTPAALTAAGLDPADIQGILLRGYTKHTFSCHMLFQFKKNKEGAKKFMKAIYPHVQSAANWKEPPKSLLHIGLTISGITTLKPNLKKEQFPDVFQNGPTEGTAKTLLKDNFGPNLPKNWTFGNNDHPVDCSVHVFAVNEAARDAMVDSVASAASSNGLHEIMPALPTPPETKGGRLYETQKLKKNFIHFDYRDGIDNPLLELHTDLDLVNGKTPQSALNNFLIGYQTKTSWVSPSPVEGDEGTFAKNGFYQAFRVLFQDTIGFDKFLADNVKNVPSSVTADKKEWLKAKMNGRWSDGSPIERYPDAPKPYDENEDPDVPFNYKDDLKGLKCPYAAHTRITNPRNEDQIAEMKKPIIRLLRRGVPYGDPNTTGKPDKVDRGLVGLFFCGDIMKQFEVMYGWLNTASTLFHPLPSYVLTQDPLVANYQFDKSKFTIPMESENNVTLELGEMAHVSTRGTAYLLMPSLTALKSCFEDQDH